MDVFILACKLWGIFSAGFLAGYCLCALLSINKFQNGSEEIGSKEAKP